MIRVRRSPEGTPLTLLVEPGSLELDGVLRLGARRETHVAVTATRPVPPRTGPLVTVAVSLVKADLLEDILRTTTELGVDRVVLLAARRSVADWGSRGIDSRRGARIASIVRSAAGQSGNRHPPQLSGPIDVPSFLGTVDSSRTWMAVAPGGEGQPVLPGGMAQGPMTVLVGPEGDFDPTEVASASGFGIPLITLDMPAMRVPTAVVVLSTLALRIAGRI